MTEYPVSCSWFSKAVSPHTWSDVADQEFLDEDDPQMKIEDDHDDHDYDDHDYEEDEGDVMMTNTMLTGYTPTQTLQSSFPPHMVWCSPRADRQDNGQPGQT